VLLTKVELMMMLRRRAKGAALDGDAHAIFTLNTMLAKQAAHKHHGASSVNLLAHSAGGEHGEIGVREFARGLMKAVLLSPNGPVAAA
jgi:hypothetical protein